VKTNEINDLMQANGSYQKQIKAQLNILDRHVKDAEETHKDEPETRVKKTVHRTYTTKFRDLLRTSQTI
jgi:t-SNARE complex subunit (syntaxin)